MGVNITKENPKMYTRLKCIHRKGFSLLLFSAPLRLNIFYRKVAKSAEIFFSCYSSASLRLKMHLPQRRRVRKDFLLLLFFASLRCVATWVLASGFCGQAATHRSALLP